MRKSLIFLALLGTFILTACGGGETASTATPADESEPSTEATAEPTADSAETESEEADASTADGVSVQTEWVCPEGFSGQQLSIYNWATYIGDTTVSDFEALCGVTVVYDVYDSDDALITRMRQGNPGYDLGFPTDYATAVLRREELLEPVDKSQIPNFANLGERFINQPFDPENQFSVPYLWGTTGIGYNRAKVGEITSFQQLFEYDGNVAWMENTRSMMGIALIQLGFDPNSTDPDEIEQAKQFLINNSDNVAVIAADDGDSLLVQGEVDIAVEYGGDMYQQILENGDDYAYIAPPGAVLDITSVVILKDAPNVELAHVFIDYMLDPNVAAHIVDTVRYATPNQAAIDGGFIPEEILNNPAVSPAPEDQTSMWFVNDIGDVEQLYNDAWDEIRVNIGQ
jgi:spermidine/putrescine transport system substrate-binding protein